jgi:hypothetical protein
MVGTGYFGNDPHLIGMLEGEFDLWPRSNRRALQYEFVLEQDLIPVCVWTGGLPEAPPHGIRNGCTL